MRISDWSSDVCSSDLAVIGELSVVLAALSEGELGRSMHGEYRGVFGGLKRSANDLAARLAEFAGRLGSSTNEIGSASCRESVCKYVELSEVAGSVKNKYYTQNKKAQNINTINQ